MDIPENTHHQGHCDRASSQHAVHVQGKIHTMAPPRDGQGAPCKLFFFKTNILEKTYRYYNLNWIQKKSIQLINMLGLRASPAKLSRIRINLYLD